MHQKKRPVPRITCLFLVSCPGGFTPLLCECVQPPHKGSTGGVFTSAHLLPTQGGTGCVQAVTCDWPYNTGSPLLRGHESTDISGLQVPPSSADTQPVTATVTSSREHLTTGAPHPPWAERHGSLLASGPLQSRWPLQVVCLHPVLPGYPPWDPHTPQRHPTGSSPGDTCSQQLE